MQFDVHFCLVSQQALANFLPILDSKFRPEKAVFFVTSEMKQYAHFLLEGFSKYQVKVDLVDISDPYDIAMVRDLVFTKVFEYDNESIALNVTGGTKTMAIAAQQAFEAAGKPFFYLNHGSHEIQILQGNQKPVEKLMLETKLGLKECLNVHGFSIEKQDGISTLTSTQSKLLSFLVRYNSTNRDAISRLNYLASKCAQNGSLKCDWSQEVGGKADRDLFKEVLEHFEEAQYLTYTKDTLAFSSVDARNFANGLWFELYVASMLPNAKIRDKAMNVVVKSGEVKNELDVAFISRNRLHILECKTRNYRGNDDEQIREAIYKLETLKRLGGLNSKCALVSYLPVENQRFRERAADSGIKLIDGRDINNLKNQLEHWIDK